MKPRFGFEYGIKPKNIIVGDVEFPNSFIEAEFIGLAYIFSSLIPTHPTPLEILFVFSNLDKAENAFSHLLGWVEGSNQEGDAVQMDFIEMNDGTYALALSQEINRLIKRAIPQHLIGKVDPIIMSGTHFKRFPQKSINYQNFKNNWLQKEIRIGYVIGNERGEMRRISNKFFLKKDFGFHNIETSDSSVVTIFRGLENAPNGFNPKKVKSLPKLEIEIIEEERLKSLKEYYPITYERITNQKWLGNLINSISKKYTFSETIQAICNIILSQRIEKDMNNQIDFSDTGYQFEILQYLENSFESFDSVFITEDFFSFDTLEKQIKEDKKQLNNYFKN